MQSKRATRSSFSRGCLGGLPSKDAHPWQGIEEAPYTLRVGGGSQLPKTRQKIHCVRLGVLGVQHGRISHDEVGILQAVHSPTIQSRLVEQLQPLGKLFPARNSREL